MKNIKIATSYTLKQRRPTLYVTGRAVPQPTAKVIVLRKVANATISLPAAA